MSELDAIKDWGRAYVAMWNAPFGIARSKAYARWIASGARVLGVDTSSVDEALRETVAAAPTPAPSSSSSAAPDETVWSDKAQRRRRSPRRRSVSDYEEECEIYEVLGVR